MRTGFKPIKPTVSVSGFFAMLAAAFVALSISGCDLLDKQAKEGTEQNAKPEEKLSLEDMQSKVRNSFKEPESTQLRNTKLLSGINVLCGEVNVKKTFGGYGGFKRFAANSSGKIVTFESITLADIKELSKKNSEERKEYTQQAVLQFSMVGQMGKGLQMISETDEMEKFNMPSFSLWEECFSDK